MLYGSGSVYHVCINVMQGVWANVEGIKGNKGTTSTMYSNPSCLYDVASAKRFAENMSTDHIVQDLSHLKQVNIHIKEIIAKSCCPLLFGSCERII